MELNVVSKDHDSSVARPQRPTLTHPEDPAVTELRAANKLAHQLLVKLVDTGHMDDVTRAAIREFSGTLANLHGIVDQVDAQWHAEEAARIAAAADSAAQSGPES